MSSFRFARRFAAFNLLAVCTALSQSAGTAPDPAATAQSTAPAAPAAPAAPPTWSVGPIDISGLIDGYYDFSANHPASNFNQLRNFDEKANQFSLNMAKVTFNHDPDPVGVHVDLGFGRAFDTVHAAEQAPEIFRYLEQVYISFKPVKAKGFEADFGEFVTSAGAEVIETKDNWNYSRSLLFAWAIPYYHFGIRTSMPITKTFTGGVQIVNGWNNVEDNNSGKTFGFTGVLTKPKYTWSANYYVGPEKANNNNGYRHLFDTTILLTPSPKFNAYLNYDYAQERQLGLFNDTARRQSPFAAASSFTPPANGPLSHYQGFAGAAHFQVTPKVAFTPRAEFFYDPQGASTGTGQTLNEITLTGEYKWVEGLLMRVEYRRDHSDHKFFDRGNTPGSSENQTTLLVGMVAFFGPKR